MVRFREVLWGSIVIMEDRKYLIWADNNTAFHSDAMIQEHKINKCSSCILKTLRNRIEGRAAAGQATATPKVKYPKLATSAKRKSLALIL